MKTLFSSGMSQPTDIELVELCLSGNREAYGRIVERYQNLICSMAYSACGSVSSSEDIAQEVFIAAWKQLGQLRERGKFKSWLCGIARNLIHNSLRRDHCRDRQNGRGGQVHRGVELGRRRTGCCLLWGALLAVVSPWAAWRSDWFRWLALLPVLTILKARRFGRSRSPLL